jgi:hypothetical protein
MAQCSAVDQALMQRHMPASALAVAAHPMTLLWVLHEGASANSTPALAVDVLLPQRVQHSYTPSSGAGLSWLQCRAAQGKGNCWIPSRACSKHRL